MGKKMVLSTRMAGPCGNFGPGQTVTVSEAVAEALEAGGFAVPAAAEKAAAEKAAAEKAAAEKAAAEKAAAGVETATAGPDEQATGRRQRKEATK